MLNGITGRHLRACALALAIACLAVRGNAQVAPQPTPPSLPSQSDISRARVGLPAPDLNGYDLRIQAPEKSAVPKAVDSIELYLTHITVIGATIFPQSEVDRYFAGLTGGRTNLEAVRNAAAALEQHYHERGYFLTRVFVPPQRLEGGALTVRVLEGFIDAVDVQGMDAGSQRAARALLAPLLKRQPIDLPALERALLILNDLPGITATGVLKQGAKLGSSTLFVTLLQTRNLYQATVSNTNSRLLGPWVYAANANLNRPGGVPGALNLGISASGPGLAASQSGSARYSLKLGSSGLIGSLGVLVARAAPVGSLRPLDIHNALLSFSTRVRYPLIRSRAQSLFLEGGLSINRSSTEILGQDLVDDRTTDLDVALTYQQNGFLSGSTTLSIDVFRGLPIFGSSTKSNLLPSVRGFEPNFTRVVLQAQRLQRVTGRISGLIATQAQLSGDKLLTGELVAFGGPAIGRGFDPSTITGDKGFGGVGEIRYDLPPPVRWLNGIQFYAFLDGARATSLSSNEAPAVTQSLRSAGGGIRLSQRYALIDLQIAKAFRSIGGVDMRPDPRILLTVTVSR